MTLKLLLFVLFVYIYGEYSQAAMLSTPHVVSGIVWDDWDKDGMMDAIEPGIPSITVSLWYLPEGQYSVLAEPQYIKVGSYQTKFGADRSSGQFSFNCLASGSYKVSAVIDDRRPGRFSPANKGDDSMDSDIVTVNGNTGWSAPFQAVDAGSSHIGIGLIQTIYAVVFSMTGDQTRPEPSPTTTVGTCYAVLNASDVDPQLYFRIVRSEWPAGQTEEPGGFYQGWEDEAPGYQVRTLSDVTSIKENVWFIPRSSFVNDLLIGRMLVQLEATGSFTDLGRLRGQFARFRRGSFMETMISLSGSSVAPTRVSTSTSGSAMFWLDLERKELRYDISIENLGDALETSATINGPAAVGETGPVIFPLPLGNHKSGVFSGLNDSTLVYFLESDTYVQIATNTYPQGHLRGQINAWQQTQYQTVVKLDQKMQSSGLRTYGNAVIQVDLRRSTLSYFIYYGGLSAQETEATLSGFDLQGDKLAAYLDGVKEGFYYVTPTDMNNLLSGLYWIQISSSKGLELSGQVTNWN